MIVPLVSYDSSSDSSSENEEVSTQSVDQFIEREKETRAHNTTTVAATTVKPLNKMREAANNGDIKIIGKLVYDLVTKVVRLTEHQRSHFMVDRASFRTIEDQWTSDSELSSCASSSSDSDHDDSDICKASARKMTSKLREDSTDEDSTFTEVLRAAKVKRTCEPKVKEAIPRTVIPSEDVPDIESLHITVPPESPLTRIGRVVNLICNDLIIESDFGAPALDEKTVLFTECRIPIGQVSEIFGPVHRPMYCVPLRNSAESIQKLGLSFGLTGVFCVPGKSELTIPVFTDALRKLKGSDASWEDNSEVPAEYQDFSDDEEERRNRAKHRPIQRDDMGIPQSPKRGRGRGRGRGRYDDATQLPFSPFPAHSPRFRGGTYQRAGRASLRSPAAVRGSYRPGLAAPNPQQQQPRFPHASADAHSSFSMPVVQQNTYYMTQAPGLLAQQTARPKFPSPWDNNLPLF